MSNPRLQTFYSILGRTLGLAIVAAEAYAETKTGGASSLLEPAHLATLIQETEQVLAPAPPADPAQEAAPNQPAAPAQLVANQAAG